MVVGCEVACTSALHVTAAWDVQTVVLADDPSIAYHQVGMLPGGPFVCIQGSLEAFGYSQPGMSW